VAGATPVVVLLTGLKASTLVTVVSVKVQQIGRREYLVGVELAKTTLRLVAKENLLMMSQDRLLVFGHGSYVEVATAAVSQQERRTP